MSQIEEYASSIKLGAGQKIVRIISDINQNSVIACAMIIKCLGNNNINFRSSFIGEISDKEKNILNLETHDLYIVLGNTDTGKDALCLNTNNESQNSASLMEVYNFCKQLDGNFNDKLVSLFCNSNLNSTDRKDRDELVRLIELNLAMDKPNFALCACISDTEGKRFAKECQGDYERELRKALDWFNTKKRDEDVLNGEDFMILNAKDSVHTAVSKSLLDALHKSEKRTIYGLFRQKEKKTRIVSKEEGLKQIDKMRFDFPIEKKANYHLIDTANEEKFCTSLSKGIEKIKLEEDFN